MKFKFFLLVSCVCSAVLISKFESESSLLVSEKDLTSLKASYRYCTGFVPCPGACLPETCSLATGPGGTSICDQSLPGSNGVTLPNATRGSCYLGWGTCDDINFGPCGNVDTPNLCRPIAPVGLMCPPDAGCTVGVKTTGC
jgi:hypothetical protein